MEFKSNSAFKLILSLGLAKENSSLHPYILTFRYSLRCVLEVVKAAVTEYKPSSFPTFPGPSLLHQPAFSVRGEEGEHQVIISLVRNLERLLLDISVDGLKHVYWKITATVNSFILSNELLHSDLDLDILVVEGCVQHDDGEGQDVDGVTVGEHPLVLLTVILSKRRHDPVNLLSLSWESEAPEELPESLDQEQVCELVERDKLGQH